MSARKTFTRQNSHNNTFCHGSASKRATSTPKNLQQQTQAGDTTMLSTTVNPKIKVNLMLPTAVNHDLEFDLMYNDYLQSLLRNQLISKNYKIQRENMEGQLAYRMDSLQKSTQACYVIRQKMEQLDSIKNADILLNSMQEILDHFQHYCAYFEVEKNLKQLLEILESENNKIYLKNVRPILKEEYSKLTELIELCSALAKNFSNFKDIEQVGKLAESIRKIKEIEESIRKKHKDFAEAQDRLGLLCLKQMSDEFARKRIAAQNCE